MARKILVFPEPLVDSTQWTVSGVFWLTATANARPLPNAISAVPLATAPGASTWGVTAAEVTALQNGTVVEQPFSFVQSTVGVGNVPNTVAAQAVVLFNVAQLALTQKAPAAKFVGSSWDGTTWTVGP